MSLTLDLGSAGNLAVYGLADQVGAILALCKHGVNSRPGPIRQPKHDRFRKQLWPTHFAYPLLTPEERIAYIRFIDKGDTEMTKAEAAQMQSQIAALRNELAQYVGTKQADHHMWMIESSLQSACRKPGGKAWLRETIHALTQILTSPRYTQLAQISPETEAWGGFLSHDVSMVPGPSLRRQFGAEG